MAPEGPEPRTFSSWEDAFAYAIPNVRGMEKQLRRDVEANKEKLRTLVGASYRDLLGTAESIIEMDGKMRRVETLMGDIGTKCNTRLIERKNANLQAWNAHVSANDNARLAFTSQLAVLRSCPDAIASLLKNEESLLLASRVLVLSRLLYTKLSKRPNPPPYLEKLKDRLATLRRRLLGKMDRCFKRVGVQKEELVEAMCAFSLATSSTATDVLRHFQHLRLEAMNESMSTTMTNNTAEHYGSMSAALRLYIQTLRDTRAVGPGQLPSALQGMKAVPIFKSQDILELEELNLDIYERGIGDDIKSFTPYVRHDDLNRLKADQMLKQWASTAIKSFLERLKVKIQDINDPKQIMKLRIEILELWLSQHRHSQGINSAEVLDGLRAVFKDQAVLLNRRICQSLKEVRDIVVSTIRTWQPGVTDVLPSLWSPEMTSVGTANSGKAFRTKVVDLSTGKTLAIQRIVTAYDSWLRNVESLENIIKEARAHQWDDDIEGGDEDDDDLLEKRQLSLSGDDPRTLEAALQHDLKMAFASFTESLTSIDLDPSNRASQSAFLLRTWRHVRQNLPATLPGQDLGRDEIPTLFENLARVTLDTPLEICSKRLDRVSQSPTFPARALWEGDPELPVLPSPWCYRLLLEIVHAMAGHGTDIWSTEAVKVIKSDLRGRLAELLTAGSGEANAATGKGPVNGNMNASSELKNEGSETDSPDKAAEIGEPDKKDQRPVTDDQAKDAEELDSQADGDEGSPTDESRGAHANGVASGISLDPSVMESKKLQRLFDVSYLDRATKITGKGEGHDAGDEFPQIQESVLRELGRLEESSIEQIKTSAAEYWKRTSLLFGLLLP